jgi:hypothetical protein
MLAELESTIAWKTIASLPSTITAEEVAFWLGRIARGFGQLAEAGAEITFGAAITTMSAMTAALSVIDAVVNTPALRAAIDEQARRSPTLCRGGHDYHG